LLKIWRALKLDVFFMNSIISMASPCIKGNN